MPDKKRKATRGDEVDPESIPERTPPYTPQSRTGQPEDENPDEVAESGGGYTPQERSEEEREGGRRKKR